MSDLRYVRDFGPEYDLVQDESSTRDLAEGEGVEWHPYMLLKAVEGEVVELWGVSFPFMDRLASRLV